MFQALKITHCLPLGRYSKSDLGKNFTNGIKNCQQYVQLGQTSVNPPRLVLEVGGTSTLQAAMPVKLKSPHFKVPSHTLNFLYEM